MRRNIRWKNLKFPLFTWAAPIETTQLPVDSEPPNFSHRRRKRPEAKTPESPEFYDAAAELNPSRQRSSSSGISISLRSILHDDDGNLFNGKIITITRIVRILEGYNGKYWYRRILEVQWYSIVEWSNSASSISCVYSCTKQSVRKAPVYMLDMLTACSQTTFICQWILHRSKKNPETWRKSVLSFPSSVGECAA